MKKLLTHLVLAVALLMPVAVPAVVSAACPGSGGGGDAKNQVLIGVGETDTDCDGSGVTKFVSSIVEILSIIVGIAAIIMLILGGFKYITSGGESGKVSSAKNTIIYALIGVAIAVLAQVLVNFVFTQAKDATSGSGGGSSSSASSTSGASSVGGAAGSVGGGSD